MAPEQLEGLPTDARTDLFAFGCVLYEMLSGKKAFEGRSGASLMTAIMAQEPTPIRELVPSLPNGVEELIGRCLAKSPDDRWQSAADLLDELRRIAGAVRSARESGWFRRFISEHRVAAVGVLVALLLSAGAAAFLSAPTPPAVPPAQAATVQLAVLPLRMVGDAIRGDEYLGVGIADSIITRARCDSPDRAPPDRGGHALRQYAHRHGDRRQSARRRARAVWHHPAERRHVSHHPSARSEFGRRGDRGRGATTCSEAP